MPVTIVVAYNTHGLIGTNKNTIPWHLPDDLKHFKKLTKGHVCIMGRKTWESIPVSLKPLSKRKNVVITRNPGRVFGKRFVKDLYVSTDLKKSILWSKTMFPEKEVFIVGGGEIYKQAFDQELVDRVVASEISDYQGYVRGVFFPDCHKHWDRKVLKENRQFDVVEYKK